MRTFLVLVFCLLAVPHPAWAHGHDDHDDETLEATFALYRQIAELTPAVTGESGEPDTADASIRLAGQTVWLNGPFWNLVRGWIRVYYRELQNECDDCLEWSEEQFTAAAEDQMARSFLSIKLKEPMSEAGEHIAAGAADVGARLGKTALVAKITGEVAETVLSKMSFMGGLHFFCHLIDAFILFGTRHIQTASRAYSWAGHFDGWGAANMVRAGFVSAAAGRAQRRVRFVSGPVEIDEAGLKEVDAEGPNRYWGWVKAGKRAAWIKRYAARGEGRVSRKEFLGTRMKRYLWLKGRKRGHRQFMKGSNAVDKSLNHDTLWILEVQESLLQRALEPATAGAATETARASLAESAAAPADDIRQGLATEFAAGDEERARFVEGLMRDVEVIFNPAVPRRVRYFQASALESLIAGFMYGQFSTVLGEKSEMFGPSFSGIWNQVRLRWRIGRFGGYIYEWSDFLRMAALRDDPKVLRRYKYEMMESLLRVLAYFGKTGPLADARSTDDLSALETLLTGEYGRLMTFRPWREKRIARSWWPWRKPAPLCRSMDQAVGP
jgi:hypothetical protein